MAMTNPKFNRKTSIKLKNGKKINTNEYKIKIIESSPTAKIDDTKLSGKYKAGLKSKNKFKQLIRKIKISRRFIPAEKLGVGICTVILGTRVDSDNILYVRDTRASNPKFRRFVVGRPIEESINQDLPQRNNTIIKN